jgi:thiamine biosynthesis lipoprotein
MSFASVSFRALGTTATICVTDVMALERAHGVLGRELRETDEACSRFRDDSELARLNAASGEELVVGKRLFEAISAAVRAAASSGGLVDPTIGRALRLAGYDRTFELVRGRDGSTFRARSASVPGWQRIVLDAQRRTVRVPRDVELDLGATAKALAADRAAREAAHATGVGVLVDLGGDVAVAGAAPTGGWPIRIAHDHAAGVAAPGPTISIASGGLASSSTTVRRWRAGDVELHHIVDPRTGRPADTPWQTVTVAAASCLDANVASTAAVVIGDGAPVWLGERALPARLVAGAGRVVCVAGWPEEGH